MFTKDLYRKLVLTAAVAGIFTFFIINGPLQRVVEALSLEADETEYSNPIMLGKQQSVSATDLVGDVEIDGFGHSLILNKKKTPSNFGFITKHQDQNGHDEMRHLIDHARSLFKGAKTTLVSHGEKSYVEVQNGDDKSYYTESKYLAPNVIGYAGPINVGILLSSEGHVKSVHHVSSKETQSYLRKIENAGYYHDYIKLPLNTSSEVDGISGATITSVAIATTITEATHTLFPEPFDNLIDDHRIHKFEVASIISNIWILHAIVITLLFIYGLQKRIKKSKRTTSVIRVISILYVGFYLNNSFTYTSMLHPFMGVTLSSLTSVYIALVLIGSIWGKNIYCKYVCPFGNAQCVAQQAAPRSWQSKFVISNKWISRFRMALSLGLITGILLGFDKWKNFELFPDLFGTDILSFWFAVALLFVLIGLKYPLLWCRALCPTGFILDTITDFTYKGFRGIFNSSKTTPAATIRPVHTSIRITPKTIKNLTQKR